MNTLGTWSPLIIKELLGNTNQFVLIGFVGAIPPLLAIIAMQFFGAQSDRGGERNRHCAYLMMVSAIGWLVMISTKTPAARLLGLSICYVGSFSAIAIFWTAAGRLPGDNQAARIAAVSTIGTFASILSPSIVGILRDMTNSMTAGVWYSETLLIVGIVMLLMMVTGRRTAS